MISSRKGKFWKSGSMTVVYWKDKRDVFAISSSQGNGTTIMPPNRGEADAVEKPDIICDYNDNMGGVDLLDQVISNYDMQRKSMKWWKKVSVLIIELCVANAFVLLLHNPQHKKKNSVHRALRETLATQLTRSLLDNKIDTYKSPHAHYKSDAEKLVGKHFPIKHSERDRCTACAFKRSASGKKKDTKTKNFCQKCDKFNRNKCF